MHRRQKISKESCPGKVAVQPQGYPEAPSISVAQTKTNHRGKQYRLLENILARDNMLNALRKVEHNKGAPGIDKMEVPHLRKHLREEWQFTKSSLLSGTYKPMPVREVDIPKPDGGFRTLGIPTVQDRMIQQAVSLKLMPIFDKDFSEYSYGFRLGRSAYQAVQKSQRIHRSRLQVGSGHRYREVL